ncbi:MAG: hypothetical protein QGG36_24770 [Pirellulaceae bacterium]|nr:hypothetical protein [Pirellulaceae bacterium]
MKTDALEAQKLVRKFFVVDLDFSVASVQELEGLVDDVDLYLRGGKSSENVELLTRIWGAYLGEVICRHLGGTWAEEDGVAVVDCNGKRTRPHDQVQRRLTDGDEHNLAQFVGRHAN